MRASPHMPPLQESGNLQLKDEVCQDLHTECIPKWARV